jgi:hypothetical protein
MQGSEPATSAGRAQILPPDLDRLVQLWPSLPEKVRASILTIVEASAEK